MVRPEDQAFVRWRSAGDAEALAQVYDLAAPALLRLALHHVRHPATAEDLVQATFVAAIQNAAGYDAARPLLGWLVGILHNQAKWLQRREGRAVDAARLVDRQPVDPLAAAQTAEFTAQCDEAIEDLPEVYRPVLRLHLKHELPAAEIAHVLDRPPGTVRSQITRGLELLRAALPAGTALAAFAVLTPGRGLAAVREVVLATGRTYAAAAGASFASAVVFGGVAMKKSLLVMGALLALVATAWWFVAGRAGADLDAAATASSTQAVGERVAASAATTAESAAQDVVAKRAPAPPEPVVWQLVGMVVNAAGGASVDGDVRVRVGFGHETEALVATRTGADGRYVADLGALRTMPPIDLARAELSLVVTAPCLRASGRMQLPHHDPARSLVAVADAMLVPTAEIGGRVVDTSGSPVAGAEVTLRSSGGVRESAETEPDGSWHAALLQAGSYTIDAVHTGVGSAQTSGDAVVGRVLTLPDLVLQPASRLRARVVFADGEPAVAVPVRVYAVGQEGSTVASPTTDQNGCVEVRTLPEGSYRLIVDPLTDRVTPRLVATGDESTTIVLTGIHQLRFRYQDEHGRVLRPMDVFYECWSGERAVHAAAFAAGSSPRDELGRGSPSGAGAIENVLVGSGTWVRVEADHQDARAEVMHQALPPANVHDVVLTLRELVRSASLRLDLTSADPGPVGGVELRLHQLRLGEPGSYALATELSGASLVARWYPGRYRLEVKPRVKGADFGWFAPFSRTVELRCGEETTLDAVVRPGGRVRFTMHAPGSTQRADVADFTVETPAAPEASLPRTFVETLPDGWISGGACTATPLLWWPVLPPGQHVLTIRARDFAEQTLRVTIAPREVTDVAIHLQLR